MQRYAGPAIFGVVLHLALTAAGVTAAVFALAMGKLLLALLLAGFAYGCYLRVSRKPDSRQKPR